jgi:hypothetical protein
MLCAKKRINSNILKIKFSVTILACMLATKVIANDSGNLECREYDDFSFRFH